MIVYLNGECVPHDHAKISVNDRGFLFGDGVYEVIRACDGLLFEPKAHLDRLGRGLRALGIRFGSDADMDALLAVSTQILRENELVEGDATIYVQITRGGAPRTHHFPSLEVPATVYLSGARFHPPVELRERGASAITSPDIRWTRCDLKTVNLLPNVLAKQCAVEAGATEALFVRDGVVIEGASTNVFAMVDGQIRTYPECNYILPGITRRVVLELAAQRNIPFVEAPILLADLRRVEELFITGTTTDVLPVVRVDGHTVGCGRPGPVTMDLQEALAVRLAGTAAIAVP